MRDRQEESDWVPNPTLDPTAVGADDIASSLPIICAVNRKLRELSNEAVAALQMSNHPPQLFTRSNSMVAIGTGEKGRKIIMVVGEAALRGRLARAADFFRFNAKGQQVDCVPPVEVVKDILALPPDDWAFPYLEGLIEAPVLRPDGSIVDTPGYDSATGFYYAPDPSLRVPVIPSEPTTDHIEVAVSLIVDELFVDFPFVDEASKANAIAGLLTPIVKPAIKSPSPLQLYDAPEAGTGKSLGAEIVALIATGRPAEMFSAPKDEDEWRKQITTALVSGTPVVVFDNVTRRLESAELCKVLTASQYADRAFRTHEKILLPVTTVFMATGNNIQVGGDMVRRCYHVRLDAKRARPFLRTEFKHQDLKAWVLENRGELLAALLTLARAWYLAGKPRPSCSPLGSFEEWTIAVGGILQHAGVSGFLGNAASLYELSEQESAQGEAFLSAVREIFGSEPFTAAQLGNSVFNPTAGEPAKTLRDSLPDKFAGSLEDESDFTRRAGRYFGERVSKRFGESAIRVERGSLLHGRQQWKVILG
jgi:hypothetical protein